MSAGVVELVGILYLQFCLLLKTCGNKKLIFQPLQNGSAHTSHRQFGKLRFLLFIFKFTPWFTPGKIHVKRLVYNIASPANRRPIWIGQTTSTQALVLTERSMTEGDGKGLPQAASRDQQQRWMAAIPCQDVWDWEARTWVSGFGEPGPLS